jgi:DNA-binding CsgD family transcriptional regulator/tetratricopeptide (TPR) repeat protein
MEDVVRICRLVDGLPLALELAAAWTRILDCKAIADEVQHSIDVLISNQRDLPERHRSMRAVFDHSWRLLTQEERAVLPKLAVFRGGFTMHAAWHVAEASLRTLTSLIDKSLVQIDSHGRYDLHELLRQYANEALEAIGADESSRGAHSAFYAAFVHNRVEDLKGRRQIEAITEMNADFENLRTAWMWAADHQHEDSIAQMMDGLWIHCRIRHCERDAFPLFRYAEKKFAPKQGEAAQRLWGRLLARSAAAKDSQLQIETALAIARRCNDPEEIAFCLAQSGHAAYANREYDKAIHLFEQSIVIYRQLGDHYHTAAVLTSRLIYDHQTTWDDKQTYRDEMMRLRREIGDRVGIGYTLNLAALNEGRVGNFAEAERLWRERIAMGEAIGDLVLVALSHAHISCEIKFIWGDFAQARAEAEAAITLGTRLGAADAVGWATATLGLLASVNEDYSEGKRMCLQAARVAQLADIGKLAAWGLAVASCGLGDFEAARTHLSAAFNFLTDILGMVGEIASLPITAVFTHQRDPARSVELLALAFTHPVRASGWMEKWSLLDRLQSDLERTLGSEAFSAAWERGKQRNLADVITELRTQLFGLDTSSHKQANQSLPDPLSPRELDVLSLIANGLTNREIADQLVIGVSTVKKHIQHIYEKLNAKTRTGAVIRARELHLLS